jgi:hypothetical protein
MSKNIPTIKIINDIENIKVIINDLYNKLEKSVNDAVATYGAGEWVVDDNGTYKKFTLKDNLKSLKKGTLYKITMIKKYEAKITELKRKPKELI